MNYKNEKKHIPMSLRELYQEGDKKQFDFVYITGDALVDHPSFGTAIIARVLIDAGYAVGVISQPQNEKDCLKLGLPRLSFLVSSGNIDSMVNHYTSAKRKRSEDVYTEGGKAGRRPDRALSAYCKILKKCTENIPIICGGIEASLRRFAHYDYWSDTVRRSELIESEADILIYGMGEKQIREIADLLDSGVTIDEITEVRGTCVKVSELGEDFTLLPDFDTVKYNKKAYANAVATLYGQQDHVRGKAIYQQYYDNNGTDICYVKQNAPMAPLTTEEFDHVYSLPYTREAHPSHKAPIPAYNEVMFSLIHNRGCFGGCNFCALTLHQGRQVTNRSKESLVEEAKLLAEHPEFKGYIHDVGGPTANFTKPSCAKQEKHGVCKKQSCLGFSPCENVEPDHSYYLETLRALRALPKVKKVFVRSGLRYDYMLLDSDSTFFRELVQHHISGQLKVAPEHISDAVLKLMDKPPKDVFDKFLNLYRKYNKEYKKEQYLVPYLMSSHPGSGLMQAIELAEYLKRNKLYPEQVQDFYPTPGTISTAMYHTGINPIDGKAVYVAKDQDEKDMQRALLQFFRPEKAVLVRKALKIAKRTDLIGFTENCLVRPEVVATRDSGARFAKDKSGGGQGNKQTKRRR